MILSFERASARADRVLAFMTCVTLPTRWRLLDEAHALRQRGLAYPRDTSEADSRAGREVFLAAWRLDALTPTRSHLDAPRGGFMLAHLPIVAGASPDLDAWWLHATDGLAHSRKGRIVSRGEEPFHGLPARSAVMQVDGRRSRLVGFDYRGHRYLLLAEGMAGDKYSDRYFGSVVLRE